MERLLTRNVGFAGISQLGAKASIDIARGIPARFASPPATLRSGHEHEF